MPDADGSRSPLIGVVMGSASDWPTMSKAVDVLADSTGLSETRVLNICHEFGFRFEADKVLIGLIDLLVFRP